MFQGWFAWRNRRGDWVDAAGVLQGSAAFSSVAAPTGAVAKLDAKGAIKLNQPIQFLIRSNGATVKAHARENLRPPTLRIEFIDGSISVLPCRADSELNASTSTNFGAMTILSIADNANVVMRFDPVSKPIKSAQLNLFVEKSFGAGPAIRLFKLAIPSNAPDNSVATLEGDPRVFFRTAAFEEPLFNNLFSTKSSNRYDQHRVVDTAQGRAVEITFDPRTNEVFDTSIGFVPEATEAAFEYDLQVLPTFAPSDGGKMPGWSSRTKPDDANVIAATPGLAGMPAGTIGTLLAGNGGNKVHGNDGWSLRGGHGVPWPNDHPLRGQLALDNYAYHADMLGLYGDSWVWSQWGPNNATIGRWHRIYQRLRVNTPGQRDGYLEARIDGKLVYRKTNVYLRDGRPWSGLAALGVITDGSIGRVWLNMYHGGLAAPPTRFAAFLMRNLKVARFA